MERRHSVMSGLPLALCVSLALASLLRGEDQEAGALTLDNEVVCRVNTEAISKRQVEERMEDIMLKLAAWRRPLEAAGQWNADAQKRYDEMYIPAFRESLRRVVRERLMLQDARKDQFLKLDERQCEKRLKETLERLRSQGLLGAKGFTVAEVEKRLHDSLLLDTFHGAHFGTMLDQPSRPEVQKYYRENLTRFYRPAGVKVRLISIDGIVVNKLTRQRIAQDARKEAERLREDLVSYAANFAEVAKVHSNDEDSKARGGLIMVHPTDPYLNPGGYSTQLAAVLRDMKVGEISPVFDFGKSSCAFVLLEGRREAGPAPLEGEVYDEIFRTLLEQKTRKQRDEWFRKALAQSLVVHVVDGVPKTLPVEFFFEEEAGAPDDGGKNPPPAPKKG